MLWNTIKLECKKAVFNKMFLAAVLIGCTITIFGLIPHLQGYYREINMENQFAKEFSDIRNPMLPISTLFNSWIGSEAMSPGSVYYFFSPNLSSHTLWLVILRGTAKWVYQEYGYKNWQLALLSIKVYSLVLIRWFSNGYSLAF